MRRRALAALLLAAVGAAFVACGPDRASAPDGPDRVRAVVLPYLTMMPFYIAAAEGYFEQQNLDVEFIRLPGQGMMEALAEGEVDVAPGMLTVPVLQAIASGARLRVVGALGVLANDACPFNAFVARSELVESGALRSRDGLQQLRWDADVQLPHGYWVDEALRRFDLTIDDLRIVALSEPEAVDAIVGGTVDVTIVSEPSLSRILASGAGSIWRGTNEVAAGFPLSLLMYGPTLLDQRPEVGERFAAAVLAAMRQYAEGSTPRNLEIVARATNLDEELLGEACWPVSPSDGQADPDSLQGYQTWAVAQGFTDRLLPGDELIDRRFMDAAVRLAAPPR